MFVYAGTWKFLIQNKKLNLVNWTSCLNFGILQYSVEKKISLVNTLVASSSVHKTSDCLWICKYH